MALHFLPDLSRIAALPQPLSFNIKSARYVIDTPWMRIRQDDVLKLNGADIEPSVCQYYVIEGRNWTNILAIDVEGNVALVHEYRHGHGAPLLGLPGGLIEPTDESTQHAAQRELVEEIGICPEVFIQTGTMPVNPATHTNFGFSFLAICPERVFRETIFETDLSEPMDIVITPFSELISQCTRPYSMLSAYDVCSIFRAFAKLREIRQSYPDPKLQAIANVILSNAHL